MLASAFLLAPAMASAQDCADMLLFHQGSHQVRASYDAKGKETGRVATDVTAVTPTGAGVTADVHSVTTNAKGKEQGATDYQMTCEAGIVRVDMKSLVSPESTEAYKDFEMTMEGENLEWPSPVTAGQTLPDATMTMTFTMAGAPAVMPPTKMTFHVLNRVVEGPESVTTPAGTFETWKVKYDLEVAMKGMVSNTTQTSAVEWYTPGVGAVKTELWNRGKLDATTVLVEAR